MIKQLKKHIKKLFDAEKSKYLDDDDEEYRIKDIEQGRNKGFRTFV